MKFCEQPAAETNVSAPGCITFGTRFDPALLSPACITRSTIQLPETILRSIPRRQAEFLAGRLCASSALEALTGIATAPAQGADRAPKWPASICGSITHNRHRALAIVAYQKDVRALGIDIETRLDQGQSQALAGEILVKREHERFLNLPKEQRPWLLTLTFSLKESLYKALFPLTGTQFYFEHAELLDWSAGGHARMRLLCALSDEFPANTEITGRFCELDEDLLSYIAIANC